MSNGLIKNGVGRVVEAAFEIFGEPLTEDHAAVLLEQEQQQQESDPTAKTRFRTAYDSLKSIIEDVTYRSPKH